MALDKEDPFYLCKCDFMLQEEEDNVDENNAISTAPSLSILCPSWSVRTSTTPPVTAPNLFLAERKSQPLKLTFGNLKSTIWQLAEGMENVCSQSPDPLSVALAVATYLQALGVGVKVLAGAPITKAIMIPPNWISGVLVVQGLPAPHKAELFVVDCGFRQKFLVVRPTPIYTKFVHSFVPSIYVGTQQELNQKISEIVKSVLPNFVDCGLELPPWRTAEAIKALYQCCVDYGCNSGSLGTQLLGYMEQAAAEEESTAFLPSTTATGGLSSSVSAAIKIYQQYCKGHEKPFSPGPTHEPRIHAPVPLLAFPGRQELTVEINFEKQRLVRDSGEPSPPSGISLQLAATQRSPSSSCYSSYGQSYPPFHSL